jgi:hypothetical protein
MHLRVMLHQFKEHGLKLRLKTCFFRLHVAVSILKASYKHKSVLLCYVLFFSVLLCSVVA